MEGKKKGEKGDKRAQIKGRDPCLLHRVHLGVMTGRSAGRLAFLQTGRHTKESRSPAKTQCCEHGSSPGFPKPERKGVKNSNFISSVGKRHPVEWFYQGARPSDSPKCLRHIFGPIAEGRHEDLKTRAPSNKHGEVPSLGDQARGKPDPREAREVPQPLAAPRLLRRQPCRQDSALARSLLHRRFPGQSGSSPAPTGSILLGEIRDRTTLAGELLHSPKAGKKPCSALG